jgi:hypothetical protein
MRLEAQISTGQYLLAMDIYLYQKRDEVVTFRAVAYHKRDKVSSSK